MLSELGGLTEDDLRRHYQVMLANPPFAGMLPKESIRSDLPTNSKKSELLFLGAMMQSLAPGGRCAIVVPEGVLFGSNRAHVDLRAKLVNDFDILAVVSLPAGVFKPYTGVKTAVLVFCKLLETGTKKVDQVWFYEVRNDGYDPDKITGGGRPETPQQNSIPELLRQWKTYKDSGFKEPPGVESGTLLKSGSEKPTCWWASSATLAQNDYNLAAGRYKPQLAEEASGDDPADLIREVLAIEQEITTGLERLLQELEAVD